MPAQPGTMRPSSQAATARNITPKRFLIVSIHAPARGSSAPADAPTSSSGVPMPSAMDNIATPPRTASPVFATNVSAPISTGATQAETMSADNAPMTATPMKVPARCLLLASLSRVWMKLGISMVNSAEHRCREHDEQQRERYEDVPLVEDGLQIHAAADEGGEHAHQIRKSPRCRRHS